MTPERRRLVLFALLAVVVGWSGWLALSEDTPTDADSDLRASSPAAPAAPVVTEMRTPDLLPAPPTPPAPATGEPRLALSTVDLFPRQSWYVAPPPPPPPPPAPYVPPPPPEAPPLPYSYIGRWQEGGETTFYLARGALPVSVRPGQVLDGVWKLEAASSDALSFTYLPLNQTRILRTGD